jgi:uncharacterized protein YwqG
LTVPDDGVPRSRLHTPAEAAYKELQERLVGGFGPPQHRLLGHPETIQGSMELECQLASNGVAGRSHRTARAKALKAGAADWQLLLQIDSENDGPQWCWGDFGRIYFWIKRQDLAALRFDDVWLMLQCT